MSRQKRPFYIIGHNPNSSEQVKQFLDKGANALAPDIVHVNGKFYVGHSSQFLSENAPTVQEYISSLKVLIDRHQYNLALLLWDMKNANFDINKLISMIKEAFGGPPFDHISMIMTHARDCNFVCGYKGTFTNVGVGVDESNVPPDALAEIFLANDQKNFSYGDGIITILNKPEIFKNARAALKQRDTNQNGGFKFVYPWVLANPIAMRKYLNSYVDGIIVDTGAVARLKSLIIQSPYNDSYQLAVTGDNPFNAPVIPLYLLTVKTCDKLFAGTNAEFLFTLKGVSGKVLQRLPFNANARGLFERGSKTYLTIEGINIEEIESLTIELINGGIGSGWLPESISIECKMTGRMYNFDFNGEWITKRGGPTMKFPSRGSAFD